MASAWNIYTTHFQVWFISALLLAAPLYLAGDLLLPTPTQEDYLEYEAKVTLMDPLEKPWEYLSAITGTPGYSESQLWIQHALEALEAISALLITAIVISSVALALQGQEPNFGRIFHKALRSWPMLIIATLISLMGLLLGFAALIIPGIVLWVYWTFVGQAVVLEEKYFFSALAYSAKLIKGHFFEVLSRLLLLYLAIILITFAIVSSTSNLAVYPGVTALIATISELVGIFATIFITVYFKDLQKNSQLGASVEALEESSDTEE